MMLAVITADIINSRATINQDIWIEPLKACLAQLGPSPEMWEIYRGDSFQVEVSDPERILGLAIHIKAIMKSTKQLDVRIAIGFGEKSHKARSITESNGSAYIRSGEAFEGLKKDSNLAIASEWHAFDEEINLYLKLANVIMSGWKPATAKVVKVYMSHPSLSQEQLADLIGMKQPSVSDALSRASYYELMELDAYFRKRLKKQLAGI